MLAFLGGFGKEFGVIAGVVTTIVGDVATHAALPLLAALGLAFMALKKGVRSCWRSWAGSAKGSAPSRES